MNETLEALELLMSGVLSSEDAAHEALESIEVFAASVGQLAKAAEKLGHAVPRRTRVSPRKLVASARAVARHQTEVRKHVAGIRAWLQSLAQVTP